jgi:hypothetical protein
MADESKIDGNAREEVVLSPKAEGDSPTRNKQPLKLRFWPTDGKHLNPAVRGMLFVAVLGFLGLIVYGVMARVERRRLRRKPGMSNPFRMHNRPGRRSGRISKTSGRSMQGRKLWTRRRPGGVRRRPCRAGCRAPVFRLNL